MEIHQAKFYVWMDRYAEGPIKKWMDWQVKPLYPPFNVIAPGIWLYPTMKTDVQNDIITQSLQRTCMCLITQQKALLIAHTRFSAVWCFHENWCKATHIFHVCKIKLRAMHLCMHVPHQALISSGAKSGRGCNAACPEGLESPIMNIPIKIWYESAQQVVCKYITTAWPITGQTTTGFWHSMTKS